MVMRTQRLFVSALAAVALAYPVPSIAQTPAPSSTLFQDLQFRLVGPSRGGRVTAVTGIATEPGTFYLGSSGGGVWKSTDYGQSWDNVSDGFFASSSIGAIDVADSDPSVVYVGTGSDGIRSNVITGRGVYKSTDAGKTWSFVGLRGVGQIGAVVVDPHNPDIVFVAAIGNAFVPNADRGVFRTTDGGATWRKVLFVSDSTGAADLELAPDNPREVYATMWRGQRKPWTIISGAREGGIYKSTDGGDGWQKLAGGLPRGLIGKSDLAVSAADPSRVYALVEAPVGEGGVYRSDDRGATWTLMSTQSSLLDRPFYYDNIDADPTDADAVFVETTGFFGSSDGGKTWRRKSAPHGDHHDLWINPNDHLIWIESNDGGANVTRDGGRTWSTQLNQPTGELYQVAVDDRTPYWLYAGQQDNTTIAVPSLPPADWRPDTPAAWWKQVGGCETGPAIPKPGDPAIVYSNCKGQFGRYDDRTGQEQAYWVGARDLYGHDPKEMRDRFQRVSPIAVSPHPPHAVYHASQYLYKTLDEGKTWIRISPDLTAHPEGTQVISGEPITRDVTGEEYYSTLYAVQESGLEAGAIIVGSNDGPVHLTRNGGRTWVDVTPKDLAPGGRIQNVEWSPHVRGKAYFAAYRYLLGDYAPYIYRTTDYGKTWTRLTTGQNGIPVDDPTRVVREDSNRPGLLYAGTDYGLFVSFDDGGHWQPFQQNLPITPVTDLVIHRKDLVLSTMGRAFWILDDLSPLEQLRPEASAGPAYLFTPRNALRLRYAAGGRGSPSDYPSPGMYFDYELASAPAGEVKLEILDPAGAVLRSFSSELPPGAAPSNRAEDRGAFLVRAGVPQLSKQVGHNRFRWDFSLPGPWDTNASRSGRGGPWVAPGSYQVRLTVGDWSATRPFRILIDPRVAKEGVTVADLVDQQRTAMAVRDLLSRARHLANDVAAALRGASGAAKDRLTKLNARLVADESVRYPTPELVDELEYLYRMTGIADQRLGRDVGERRTELARWLREAEQEYRAIQGSGD
jgi:photosystem II stability/assembly factor-like uncharacterized protein